VLLSLRRKIRRGDERWLEYIEAVDRADATDCSMPLQMVIWLPETSYERSASTFST
jgi:hypothetical protein